MVISLFQVCAVGLTPSVLAWFAPTRSRASPDMPGWFPLVAKHHQQPRADRPHLVICICSCRSMAMVMRPARSNMPLTNCIKPQQLSQLCLKHSCDGSPSMPVSLQFRCLTPSMFLKHLIRVMIEFHTYKYRNKSLWNITKSDDTWQTITRS